MKLNFMEKSRNRFYGVFNSIKKVLKFLFEILWFFYGYFMG